MFDEDIQDGKFIPLFLQDPIHGENIAGRINYLLLSSDLAVTI
jgi:hypothetical protein